MAKTINAKDPGSLFVGNNPEKIAVGDLVLIEGDTYQGPRKCTYVMGSVEKSNVHLVFRGTGPVPVSAKEITYQKTQAVRAVPETEKATA